MPEPIFPEISTEEKLQRRIKFLQRTSKNLRVKNKKLSDQTSQTYTETPNL